MATRMRDTAFKRVLKAMPPGGEVSTAGMLAKYVGGLAAAIYYSAGPPGLVAAMQKMLSEAGINEDDIVTEEFDGY